ncbi:MAG: MBL fold metallo-hydrolase [Propionicimonas sp.]
MLVTLLGTGSADGLPNPWCRCPTCADARESGLVRCNTSVLVDGRLLLDCGPETPRQAGRFGHDLTEVEAVAIGHAHHDHLDPSFLLYRSWVDGRPLQVIGPPAVIDHCGQWLDPADTSVTLREVAAGEQVNVAGYSLTALEAQHHAFGKAVLYLVDDGSSRLLYATDTGPFPPRTLAALRGTRLDAALLEETFGTKTDGGEIHLHLETFGRLVDQLRAIEAVTPTTQVVAIHLSHHNPPLADLQEALAEFGALAHPDGTQLRV